MYNPVLAKSSMNNIDDYSGTFPVVVMPKLDGFRCGITHPRKPVIEYKEGKYDVPDEVVAWSRNGKNIPSLFVQSIMKVFYDFAGEGWDGELTAGENFQDSARVMQKGSKDDSFSFVYTIFDYNINAPFPQRLDHINKVYHSFITARPELKQYFSIVQYGFCSNHKDLKEAYYKLKTEEGVMLRVITDDGYMRGKRDPSLIKVKPLETSEAVITGFDVEKYGKNLKTIPEELWGTPKNRAGKLIVVGVKGSIFEGKTFKVGSGLTHEQREDIFKNFDQWINKVITFQYLPCGSKNKPRHPVFKGFRHDYIEVEQCI